MNKKLTIVRCTGAELLILMLLAMFIYCARYLNSAGYVDMDTISVRMAAIADNAELTTGDTNSLYRIYGLAEDSYTEFCSAYTESVLDVTQYLVLYCDTDTQLANAEERVNSYLEEQKSIFRDYGAEQYGLLKNAAVLVRGKYLFMAVSEAADEWESEFISTVR